MMSIKQQKDIKKFLEGEYTFDTAEQIYKKQEDSLMSMLETVKNESKSRYKTLKQTILPRIALYKVLGYGGDCCDFHFSNEVKK